uniref:Galactose-1-phosphate uridylyltransferase n=1 Tax=Lygus hesperus TaxID=30085 RepID=A0A0A9WMC9_LYGHE
MVVIVGVAATEETTIISMTSKEEVEAMGSMGCVDVVEIDPIMITTSSNNNSDTEVTITTTEKETIVEISGMAIAEEVEVWKEQVATLTGVVVVTFVEGEVIAHNKAHITAIIQ